MGTMLRVNWKNVSICFIGTTWTYNAVLLTSYQNCSFKCRNNSYPGISLLTPNNFVTYSLAWRITISTETYSFFVRKAPCHLIRRFDKNKGKGDRARQFPWNLKLAVDVRFMDADVHFMDGDFYFGIQCGSQIALQPLFDGQEKPRPYRDTAYPVSMKCKSLSVSEITDVCIVN